MTSDCAFNHDKSLQIYFCVKQGSRNSEIWIGPADYDDVVNEPISKVKI